MGDLAVQIKNFQIIENAKLKFPDGLTIIVGPSNNGKSAIIRAIEALVYNKAGNSFIRNGTDYAAIAVQTEDGRKVIFKKSATAGEYIIDGQPFNKIGRGQLDEVASALNMQEITINEDKVRINFLKQMEYPFLLDRNPTQLFNFLAMSNDTSKLADVFASMRSDLKAANSEVTELIGKADGLTEIITRDTKLLENYKDIDSIVDNILGLDTKVTQLNQTQEEIQELKNKKNKLISLKPIILKLRGDVQLAHTLLDGLDERITAFTELQSQLSVVKSQRTELISKKESILAKRTLLSNISKALAEVDLSAIETKSRELSELRSALTSLSTQLSTLNKKEALINTLRTDLLSVQGELSEFKVCPLCGQPLTEGEHHDDMLH